MKKILWILLAATSIFVEACSTLNNRVQTKDTTSDQKIDQRNVFEKLPNSSRDKGDAPGRKSLIRFWPDSQVVIRKTDTIFLIYDDLHSCFFATTKGALWRKIRSWLPEEIKNSDSKNSVLLVGTIIDPITLILKEDLPDSSVSKKILRYQYNGIKIYGITSHAHYPDGPPKEIVDEVDGQNNYLKNIPSPKSSAGKPSQTNSSNGSSAENHANSGNGRTTAYPTNGGN